MNAPTLIQFLNRPIGYTCPLPSQSPTEATHLRNRRMVAAGAYVIRVGWYGRVAAAADPDRAIVLAVGFARETGVSEGMVVSQGSVLRERKWWGFVGVGNKKFWMGGRGLMREKSW